MAWSPTMLTTGLRARRALCKLASPLPRPGPRWRSVAAGRPAMRAYPSAAPVATPSKSPSTLCIAVTSSSAATKCISEVPGFMKQVSTPWPTSVRISPWAPFIRFSPPLWGWMLAPHGRQSLRGGSRLGHRVEDGAGVEDARGVEGGFDPAHERELHRVLELEEVRALGGTDAVLARDRAAHRTAGGDDPVQEPVPDLCVGLPHRQVHVAVRGVPAADDQRGAFGGGGADLVEEGRGGDARGTTTSTISSAPVAFADQKARSRARIISVPAWVGRTYTSSAPRPSMSSASAWASSSRRSSRWFSATTTR